MQRPRNIIFVVALFAAVLVGAYLLSMINSNTSVDRSSASVYNIVGLSQIEDSTLYSDKIVIEVNSQILSTEKITEGNLEFSFDKNLLEVEDIIMPSNIIALNQKIDGAEGKITLQFQTTDINGLKDINNIAKLVFNKKQDSGKFTSVTLLSSSTLGNPNTLDASDKSVSISY